MNCLDEPTLNREWCAEQTDRLLGFELLTRVLTANHQPIEPGQLADKVALDKGISHRIIKGIQCKLTTSKTL